HGGFAVGGRVDHATDTFDGLADVARGGVCAAALERHVLHEMADAASRFILIARADLHHERDRHRRAVSQRDADQARAVCQAAQAAHGCCAVACGPRLSDASEPPAERWSTPGAVREPVDRPTLRWTRRM